MTHLLLLAAALAAEAPPNVVLIISDDHGWSDYGFMQHPQARTPRIDALAKDALLFTRGYVPTSLCRPSLASILTGLYPHQHGITGNDPPGNARDAANRERMAAVFRKTTTLTEHLASRYVSHQSGKWWEGQCTCCGFTQCMTHGDPSRGGRHGDDGLKIGRQTMQPVLDFVDKAKQDGKPFLLWYAPMMPHTPHNPPARLLARYQALQLPEAQAKYLAMVEWFDETVGQLVDHIESRGLAENTIFIYLADNGWVQLEGKQPLAATRAKMSPYDAGARTPIFIRWKGRVAARRDDEHLAQSIDIVPTVLKLTGAKAPKDLPGIDLTDGKAVSKRQQLFGANFVHTSIDIAAPRANVKYRWTIRGRWKLILPEAANAARPMWEGQPETGWGQSAELYDVLADPAERKDLAAAKPDLVRSLRRDLDRWWKP